ncbi:MAG: CoA transferase, partial [Oricola sp.]
GPHWSRTYTTADGGFISVQCLEPKFYALFLDAMGLTGDPQFARQFETALWPELTRRLAEMFAMQPRAHWEERFEGSDACVAPVLDPAEAASDSHMAARGVWHGAAPVLQAAPAPRFSGDAAWTPPASPARGEHTEEILAELANRVG